MSIIWLRILLVLVLIISSVPKKSDGQYCIADEQTPEEVLQEATVWACGNGADCSKIQENQSCFLPNNPKDHASFAFNSYFQKFKSQGGSCYFKGASMVTDLDPSHDSCQFDYIP